MHFVESPPTVRTSVDMKESHRIFSCRFAPEVRKMTSTQLGTVEFESAPVFCWVRGTGFS